MSRAKLCRKPRSPSIPLITDPEQASEIFEEARRAGVCIPAFDTGNRDTTEAIFRPAAEIGEDLYSRARGRSPRMEFRTQTHQRDAVWMPTVVETMKHYFPAFGYAGLATNE